MKKIEMKLTIVKQLNNTFKVAYDSDYDKLRKIKVGDLLNCTIIKPRNYKFHCKFMALIDMVYQNQERYNNFDHLRKDLIIEAGFYNERINIKGIKIKEAKSINFSKMEEVEFNELYDRVIDVIIKEFNFGKQDILDNIEQFF